ncbi:hypothetical protein PA05_2122 [Cutibacterium acnes P05]|nr:hypothetical protein [Cutibacterium acnes P05]
MTAPHPDNTKAIATHRATTPRRIGALRRRLLIVGLMT